MVVSINGGTPKWMVYNGKYHENGWFGGTPVSGNLHIGIHPGGESSWKSLNPWPPSAQQHLPQQPVGIDTWQHRSIQNGILVGTQKHTKQHGPLSEKHSAPGSPALYGLIFWELQHAPDAGPYPFVRLALDATIEATRCCLEGWTGHRQESPEPKFWSCLCNLKFSGWCSFILQCNSRVFLPRFTT